jgi:hypothetical protein
MEQESNQWPSNHLTARSALSVFLKYRYRPPHLRRMAWSVAG